MLWGRVTERETSCHWHEIFSVHAMKLGYTGPVLGPRYMERLGPYPVPVSAMMDEFTEWVVDLMVREGYPIMPRSTLATRIPGTPDHWAVFPTITCEECTMTFQTRTLGRSRVTVEEYHSETCPHAPVTPIP